jgi:hypothetical protein
LSYKPIDKLYVKNKSYPKMPNIIDPSHLILNIKLNILRNIAILNTSGDIAICLNNLLIIIILNLELILISHLFRI